MQVSLDGYRTGAAVATALVNTGPEAQSNGDLIPDADDLGRFLAAHNVPLAGRAIGPDDVTRTHALRAALREVITSPTAAEMAERAGELASAVGAGPVLGAEDGGQ